MGACCEANLKRPQRNHHMDPSNCILQPEVRSPVKIDQHVFAKDAMENAKHDQIKKCASVVDEQLVQEIVFQIVLNIEEKPRYMNTSNDEKVDLDQVDLQSPVKLTSDEDLLNLSSSESPEPEVQDESEPVFESPELQQHFVFLDSQISLMRHVDNEIFIALTQIRSEVKNLLLYT